MKARIKLLYFFVINIDKSYIIFLKMKIGDILHAQKLVWEDPNNILKSWDPTLVNPCTWYHVTCNNDNSVIRLYVFLSSNSYQRSKINHLLAQY